ncbi:MAG: acyl transferase/acyl hydrolase/lysophospholipase [Linnemannia elongata]|nr:MAG: acyl transferase/acyl hydrolase/lysophospholipase [Linnemannia elongata]
MSILLLPARTARKGPWTNVRSANWRPLLVPTLIHPQRYRSFFSSPSTYNNSSSNSSNSDPKVPLDESRWSDVKSSVLVLLSVCSAILLPTKAVSNESKAPPTQRPVLELKVDPRDPKEQEKEKEREKDKDKIKLPGPLPDIPIPKISLDDLMEKVHDLGEKIGEEIKGRVPTLADYFSAVDTIRKELQLGDGSLYQSIVNNMSDANKNPEIQLDASVRQGNDLCPQELAFQAARRKKMKKAFAKFIGVKESDIHENDIPVVALAGSGGGYRAMISSLGYMTAAKKAGLFDCTMYMAGVSGSCWMIAQYLTLGQRSFTKTMEHFKQSLSIPIAHYPSFIDTMLTNPGAAQLILEGVVQKYSKNRVLTLVDAFGTVLGSRLLIHRERDGDNGEWVDPLDFKMSQQSRWVNYGDQPLPIYTAVSHVLPGATSQPDPIEEIIVDDEVAKEDSDEHYYQWFEMTPYEFGSEETSAWIPTWSFGRRFVEGKSVEKVPETNLAILLGTFGSAFTATLADYYNEVRPLLNKAMSDSMDTYIKEYLDGMSLIHPLSPSCFPNPIYKLPNPEPEAEAFSQRKNIYLNDAGMDNNLPLYPLLRPGRKIDVILAFDSSADIESVPWFEKADEYVKRRGIERWPPISKKRAEQLAKQEGGPPRKMTHVEIFHGIVAEDRDADHVVPVEKKKSSDDPPPPPKAVTPLEKSDVHPITLIYFPLIPNQEYHEFNPGTEAFCSTFNFELKEDQVQLLAGLGENNFSKGLEDVRKVLKETWLRKRQERLEREKLEKKMHRKNPVSSVASTSTPGKADAPKPK